MVNVIITCLEEQEARTLHWPVRSSDLSHIEYIWDMKERSLCSLARLLNTLQEQQQSASCMGSYPSRKHDSS